MCEHEQVECPNHEGGFDCNSFCRICEGSQGYCLICEPIEKGKTMSDLPEKINVMKVVTYDVNRLLEIIHEETEKPFEEITREEVVARAEDFATGDFSCDWGHETNLRDLIFQDENGEEL